MKYENNISNLLGEKKNMSNKEIDLESKFLS